MTKNEILEIIRKSRENLSSSIGISGNLGLYGQIEEFKFKVQNLWNSFDAQYKFLLDFKNGEETVNSAFFREARQTMESLIEIANKCVYGVKDLDKDKATSLETGLDQAAKLSKELCLNLMTEEQGNLLKVECALSDKKISESTAKKHTDETLRSLSEINVQLLEVSDHKVESVFNKQETSCRESICEAYNGLVGEYGKLDKTDITPIADVELSEEVGAKTAEVAAVLDGLNKNIEKEIEIRKSLSPQNMDLFTEQLNNILFNINNTCEQCNIFENRGADYETALNAFHSIEGQTDLLFNSTLNIQRKLEDQPNMQVDLDAEVEKLQGERFENLENQSKELVASAGMPANIALHYGNAVSENLVLIKVGEKGDQFFDEQKRFKASAIIGRMQKFVEELQQ